ncbi:hypothetical protein ISN45_Aa06g012990 [Arabidopsis thaliana x Arabidopsis arenosa]|uniref:Uncharacterized protein n=1 Tax=Arabidopsis thaliana x Arabidopsis arenosa TaxID=1240361 RepID=A0A8T1YVI2_9BRAS|nr:hypothetical protein ISN45_Aa06g012990 [Arabidopsis thaliana x Arabidopsis arenosa]KAG7550527.1 hypothetical protein ISN45_Aa06g012990 [Arabidopsis thaliana x Arabidopsis arenosa]
MSGSQEPRIRPSTWSCSDIPIKKRKYLVQPQLEEAGSSQIPQPSEQGDTSVVARSALDSSLADENQKMTGPSVSVGIAGKGKNIGNIILDQIRVKVEKPSSPIRSSPLAGFDIPSTSNILGSSLHCSLGKLPVGAEHPGVVVTSDAQTGMKVEKTVLKTHDIVKETCDKETLRGECLTEASSGANTVSLQLGCNTKNNSPYWKNEEPTELNLSLSKGVCPAQNTDSTSTCTKSGNSGVNRENWDLNTTMDAWEGALDRTTRVKTTGTFLNSNRSLRDIERSSCRDTTAIAKSVSVKQKESVGFSSPKVTLMQFDNQVNPTCSLSLGLSSYPPIEKSPSLPATTSEARAACTSFTRPVMIAGNVNAVNLRTVKSEIIEESVRHETESAQVCPIGLSIKGVKHEVVGRFSQGNSPSSVILKPVVPISVKAEPNTFTQSEVFHRKDGMLNHPHTPIVQSNEIPDLPTSSTPYQKDTYIPCSKGIINAPMSLNGMTIVPGVQIDPDCTLKENSGQSSSVANGKLCEVLKHGGVHTTYSCSDHGDHNLNASGVNVTSLTEEKIVDDCKTCISKEIPRNSCGTDELSINDEEKIILSGKELEEQLYSYGFESDCGHDLSRVMKKQVEKTNLYDDGKVQGPAAVFTESNEVAHAEYGGSETERRNINIPCHGDFQNSNHMEEKGSQPALLDNTGENEGRIVQDGEGMSGVSTVSGGIENPEIVDNSSPVSYKAEMSTIDNDPPAECSDGSQSRIINLTQVSNKSPVKAVDASGSFVPSRMERDRFHDFPLEPRKYIFRGSDESYKFSRERYHGKIMRSPRLNFIPDRRRLPDNTESNLHDQDTKNFEFDNHGNTRRGGAFMSNFQRGRRPANDEVTPYSHSFPRRNSSFSFNRGPTNKEDASAFHGFRDGEKFTRGLQCNNTEPMFMNPQRPYQGRSGFTRGRTKFLNNPKRGFPGFRSRSPVRSRERSDGSSSSFRNRSQEEFSGHTDFSHRRSPSGFKMERMSSPDHSGFSREMVVRRHNSPPFSHRPSHAGRGRGYPRGRGYARGRGYGRDGNSFRKPSDRVVHRNHGNLNNLDPRERVDYSDDFFEGPIHSERFGVDVNAERRRFGYRHDGTSSSFRPSFNNDGCVPTNVENDPDAVRFRQEPHIKIEEQGSLMEIDGENKNSTENASGRTKNMEEEETSKNSEIWQLDELGGDGF